MASFKSTLKSKSTLLNYKLDQIVKGVRRSREQQVMLLFVVGFALVGITSLVISRAYNDVPKTQEAWNYVSPVLRNCESGGDYKLNSGNGYYGAYQFLPSTWAAIAQQQGRYDLAVKYPNEALEADQDAMAFALFKQSGLQPWDLDHSYGCGLKAEQAYFSSGGSTAPTAGTNTPTSINNPGTDCHNYTLQYDPSHYYPCVQHLQNDLHINPDGYFGPGTKTAVMQVQANAKPPLNQTGIVDSATWCAIHNDLPGCGSLAPPAPAAPAPVTTTPTSTSQAVQGRIFRDDNANGVRDSTEPLIGNAGNCGSYLNVDASIAAAGQLVNADRCNAAGPFYFISTPAGIQTVYTNPPQGWSVTNGNSRTVNVSPGQNVDVQWFGMRPNQTTTTPTTTPVAPTTSTTSNKTIVGVASGRCLDVSGVFKGDGGKVQIWGCIPGASNQQWVYDIPTKQIRVYSGTNDVKCLDIAGLNTSDLAPVITWSCHGGLNQQWDRRSDGTIHSKLNDKCLDVKDEGKGDGTLVQMYTCLPGHDNQRWQ